MSDDMTERDCSYSSCKLLGFAIAKIACVTITKCVHNFISNAFSELVKPEGGINKAIA